MSTLPFDPTGNGATQYANLDDWTHDDVADNKNSVGAYVHTPTRFSAHEAQTIFDIMGYIKSLITALVSGGEANIKTFTQTAHGFTVGQTLTHNGTQFLLAKADLPENAEVVGIITEVNSVDQFTLCIGGYCELVGATPFTAGMVHFQSASVAGGLTTTEPAGSYVSKPVLFAITTGAGVMYNLRGVIGGDQSVRNIKTKTSNYSIAITDDMVFADCSAGGFTLTLPAASSATGRVITTKKIDSTGNQLLTNTTGGDLIDGDLTWFTTTPNAALTVTSDGTAWHVIGSI